MSRYDSASYGEKLRDPRWQRRRLEVMERDGFECRECGEGESTLHVHHNFYRRYVDPWDYDSAELLTLCVPCHDAMTVAQDRLRASLCRLLPDNFWAVLGFADALVIRQYFQDGHPRIVLPDVGPDPWRAALLETLGDSARVFLQADGRAVAEEVFP